MWCLVYLETAISGSLSRLLKSKGYDVLITNDVDDLLDQLWYHGSEVACIIIEARDLLGLDDFIEAILDWPEIPVLAYGSVVSSIDCSISNIHCSPVYCIDHVAHDLFMFDKRHATTHC